LKSEKGKIDDMKAIWFSPMGQHIIGIVVKRDKITGENKAYIGTGDGQDEKEDMKKITLIGASFPLSEAIRLID
jgi:hypothetical protein